MLAGFLFISPVASAVSVVNCDTAGLTTDECNMTKKDDLSSRVWPVIQVVLGVLGGVAIIMIVLGGIRYTLSQGDSSALTSAKNTIIYAVVGLVVAILASGIVIFVKDFFLK